MKLLKLHIENFGKLSNQDIDFVDGINQIYKENGWGKSTLTFFIKAMFYGMSAKTRGEDYKSERTRFLPWQGGIYGGYIIYQIDGKEYKVTRTFAKTPEGDTFELLDKSTNLIEKNEMKPLGEQIFGVGVETFTMTVFFSQLDFKSSLNDSISSSLVGLDKYQNDLDKVDKAIKILKENKSGLKRLIVGKSELERLKLSFNENNSKLIKLNDEKQAQLEKEQDLIKELENIKSRFESEREKISYQELKFQEKVELESQVNQLNNQINQLKNQKAYQSNEKKDNSKLLLLGLFISLAIAVVFSVIGILNVVNIVVGIVISLAMFIASGVLLYFSLKKRNKTQNKSGDFDSEIVNLEHKLIDKQSSLAKLQDAIYPDRRELDNLSDKIKAYEMQLLQIRHNKENIENLIGRYIEENDVLENKINQTTSLNRENEEKIDLIDRTIGYLTKARENVSSRFVGDINNDFASLLDNFNIDKDRFVVDSKWNVLENSIVGMKSFEFSSQGYKDIISLCQRLILIRKIFKGERPVIILDDIFVNLDDKMLKLAKELIKSISQQYQIVYICCNERSKI